MAIPNWTVNYLRQQVGEVADRLGQPEAMRQLRERASGALESLPEAAARQIDRVLRQARSGTEQVHRWAQRQRVVTTPVINASGCLLGESVDAVPISIQAIEVAVASLASFRSTDAAALQRLDRRLHRCLSQAGDLSVAVASRFEAALASIAAVAVAQDRCILLPRSHAVSLPGGGSLPDLLTASGAMVREIGSADRVTAADWSRAIQRLAASRGARPILLVVGRPSQADLPDDSEPGRSDDQRWCVSVLPEATIWKLPEALSPQPPRVAQCIDAGADLVVVPGGGVIGGPDCGMLLGDRRHVDAVQQTAIWPALAASPETLAMLAVSLEQCNAPEDSEAVPVRSLIDTSADNLRHRAQQLATRIGSSNEIASCQITAEPARLRPDAPYRIASRQLRLKRHNLAAADWAARLARGIPAVIARVDAEALVVDLRWVPPSLDAELAQLLAGGSPPAPNGPPPPATATDRPADGSPAADIPAADIPAADIPAADIPRADISAADIPAADVSATDIPADGAPPAGGERLDNP